MPVKIGDRYVITGITLEIVSDEGEYWGMRNITTNESIPFSKAVLDNAIRLGKAEPAVEDERDPS